jgi:hypothetical protein
MLLSRNGGDGVSMKFGLFFNGPIVLLGLPWTAATAFIEPGLRDHFSYRTLEHIAIVLSFVSLYVNAVLLLGTVAFNNLFNWACILCGIQIIAFLAL